MSTGSFIDSGRPVAVVTGASRGIGAAIAEELAKAGYDLVLTCSESITELDYFAEYLRQTYDVQALSNRTDMGSPEDVQELFEPLSQVDVVVNNAGISHIGLLHEMSLEEWSRVMDVNLSSAFYTSKYAIPLMLQKHTGRILNISSVWGKVGASLEVAYSASKGGLNAFTMALAKELAPSGIAVNAIACGVIDTQMNAAFSEEEMEALRQEIPADRIGRPEEVAQLAVNLLKAPDYLTGQVITMDGGWT